ncbi:MAG: GntR family transcriptional regulator [Deltaproteobacteria bacterium]|nr:GntR family transcriptional regulator [Deltaproteobacteria bacterium]MBW2051114.1 GntR family transcriptional regulator [Deltaproteobacteria bacterium]MBW2141396.1 GntR family transcriptional regulator [Deltaproteobacteria bacterium]
MKLKKGPIPLYHQLERIVRKRILSGKISPSEALPTDYQLCKEFGVSRITVRQALKILEDDGLIMREQGRGTFVTDQRPDKFFYEMSGSLEKSFGFREAYKIELTSKKLVKADKQTADDLGIEAGEKVYLIEGVQALSKDEKHFQFLQAYVPKDAGVRIDLGELEHPSFRPTLEKASLETAVQFNQVIFATAATKKIAPVMNLKPGHPLLVNRNIFISTTNKVLGIITRYTPGDIYQIVHKMRFKRLKV